MTGDDDIVCTSVRLPEDLDEAVKAQLGYEDTKDGWIRVAIRQRLARESQSADGVQKRNRASAEK